MTKWRRVVLAQRCQPAGTWPRLLRAAYSRTACATCRRVIVASAWAERRRCQVLSRQRPGGRPLTRPGSTARRASSFARACRRLDVRCERGVLGLLDAALRPPEPGGWAMLQVLLLRVHGE